eukprot:COSAG02_NODE_33893_length_492_cov_1.837150_2_plen_61_part_00
MRLIFVVFVVSGGLGSVRGDETYSYPEYEEADEFTAPCGRRHTGSNTAVRLMTACNRVLW